MKKLSLVLLFLSMFGNVMAGEAYRFQGTRGVVYNFTKVPNKDLELLLYVSWDNILGGVAKSKRATADIEKDGTFELGAQKFSCWLCLDSPGGIFFLQSKKDKNLSYVLNGTSATQKNLAISIYSSTAFTSNVMTSTGLTIDQWRRTQDGSHAYVTTKFEIIDSATNKVIQSDAGSSKINEDSSVMNFGGYDRYYMGKLFKGQKVLLRLKAMISENQIETVAFEKTIESTFPVTSFPDSFKNIVLDLSKLNRDISGVYKVAAISRTALRGAELNCEANKLIGVIYLDDEQKINVTGDCSPGAATFLIDVTLQSNGWEKKVKGKALLEVYGNTARGVIVDENGEEIESIGFSK